MDKRYIAVDLDGTLATYDNWKPDGSIGEPIPEMINRVKQWLAEGHKVVIFTARVALDPTFYSAESKSHADSAFVSKQYRIISDWCSRYIGVILPITAQKDVRFTDFYDDRAWRVERNTGRIIE